MRVTGTRLRILRRWGERPRARIFQTRGWPVGSLGLPKTILETISRLLFLALFLAAGVAGGAENPEYQVPEPGTYSLPVIKAAADGAVVDSQGRSLRLSELTRGKVTVLSFIYTRCAAAKACPYATGVLKELHELSEKDASLAKGMRLVSMSFDPGSDTPERMAAYSALMGGRASAAEWRFITTRSKADLQPILDAYGQAVDRKRNPTDPTGPLNHVLRVFLIDAEGRIRNIYSSATLDPALVWADVRTLLLSATNSQRNES